MRLPIPVLKWAGVGLLAAALLLAAHVVRTWDRVWDAPLPDLHASSNPTVIKHGEDLVYGPAHCVECHVDSARTFERYASAGERLPLTGGQKFAAPPLGVVYSSNLTPDAETGIGRYTDPELARMLRYAVRPDGRASVRPLMQYADMSDDDLVAVLSFLRAQPPVRNAVLKNEWTPIGKVVKSLSPAFMPRTDVHPPAVAPAAAPTRQRGEYIARGVGNCSGCHSPLNQVTFSLAGAEFSGGAAIEPRTLPGVSTTLWFQPPNLTPVRGSALLRFPDRETFVARFQKGGRKYDGSPMPWDCFSHMSADDIAALYEFLRSLAPAGSPSPQDPTVRHAA